MAQPAVSVLMPVFDAERFLAVAIESVLAQSFTDFELLVVDDGSTDRSLEIARSFPDARIRILESKRNRGQTAALNRGLAAARAALVARQDADDRSHPERLARQVSHFAAQRDLALLGSRGVQIDESGAPLAQMDVPTDAASIRWQMCFDNAFIHSAVMFRKCVVWEELGGYDERVAFCQDFELWSRVAQQHTVGNLGERLVEWRCHDRSMSSRMRETALRETRAVLWRNLLGTFGRARVTERDARRLAELKYGHAAGYDVELADLYERLLDHYEALHPEVRESESFRRVVGEQCLRLAYGLARRAPLRFITLAVRGLRYSPRGPLTISARHVPRWPAHHEGLSCTSFS